jgi:hypothetical protein
VAVLETEAGGEMPTMKEEAHVEGTLTRKELQAREGAAAMAEYQAARRALIDNTARLREARLAREAAEQAAEVEVRKAEPVKKVLAKKAPANKAPAKQAPAKKVRVAARQK